jgi:sigma-B regulation protein RsbU (phosphoserine phosphatase)
VTIRLRPLAAQAAIATAVLWLLLSGVLATVSGGIIVSLFIVAPLIAATAADERRTALVAGATVVLTIAARAWHGHIQDASYWIGLTATCAASVLAVMLAGMRRRREERLARMTAIAQASQLALLPPLPPEITGISIAARYRSATPGAWVGGDLYEIIPTGHGIRVIIGDVRGKGLDAVVLARHVLSAFRRSAVAVPTLEHVAGDVSRAIRPHLSEEDFVTAVLVQIVPGGELTVVNCGHHPPLLHHSGGLRPLADRTAALPLGLEDDFTAFTASWLPGDRLLLYTDGLIECRSQRGDFLPQDRIAAALLAADCDQALDALMTAVDRHTGGHSHDDMALLLLGHGAHPYSSANGHRRFRRQAVGQDCAERASAAAPMGAKETPAIDRGCNDVAVASAGTQPAREVLANTRRSSAVTRVSAVQTTYGNGL